MVSLSIHIEASVLVSSGIGVNVPDSRNTLERISLPERDSNPRYPGERALSPLLAGKRLHEVTF